MSNIQAIILGAIQGLTEFIPISSSAHLVIIPRLFHWKPLGLTFDVALHLGTTFALLGYFWRDWFDILKGYFKSTRFGTRIQMTSTPRAPGFLFWPIIIACIPAGIVGLALNELISTSFRDTGLIATAMIVLGLMLFIADKAGPKDRSLEAIRTKDWVIIGFAQALALIPGVSRSGITITAALLCGLNREASARFSFLLGTPIIIGAAVYELRHIFFGGFDPDEMLPFILGVVSATAVGYLCIGFLMSYLKRKGMGIFVGYRIVVGIFVVIMHVTGAL